MKKIKELFQWIFPCLRKKIIDKQCLMCDEPFWYTKDELQLLNLINFYRIHTELNELAPLSMASFLAKEHNDNMIINKNCDHLGFDDRSEKIVRCMKGQKVNENVGCNFSTPDAVMNAWLKSSGHRMNIEGVYTHIGLAVTTDQATSKKYYTTIFVKI